MKRIGRETDKGEREKGKDGVVTGVRRRVN